MSEAQKFRELTETMRPLPSDAGLSSAGLRFLLAAGGARPPRPCGSRARGDEG
jgi:hypothetical protein